MLRQYIYDWTVTLLGEISLAKFYLKLYSNVILGHIQKG